VRITAALLVIAECELQLHLALWADTPTPMKVFQLQRVQSSARTRGPLASALQHC
jgi:hypothetical protein